VFAKTVAIDRNIFIGQTIGIIGVFGILGVFNIENSPFHVIILGLRDASNRIIKYAGVGDFTNHAFAPGRKKVLRRESSTTESSLGFAMIGFPGFLAIIQSTLSGGLLLVYIELPRRNT